MTDDKLAGLTVKDCPVACTAKRCALSWKSYCGHPFKGGLQPSDMRNKKALDRLIEAKSRLAHEAVDRKAEG